MYFPMKALFSLTIPKEDWMTALFDPPKKEAPQVSWKET